MKPLRIGPDGLVESATERDMAHLTRHLGGTFQRVRARGKRNNKRKNTAAANSPGSSSSASAPIKICPLCNAQVRGRQVALRCCTISFLQESSDSGLLDGSCHRRLRYGLLELERQGVPDERKVHPARRSGCTRDFSLLPNWLCAHHTGRVHGPTWPHEHAKRGKTVIASSGPS